MEIVFYKTVKTTIDVDPIKIAEIAVKEYKDTYKELNESFIDWALDNMDTLLLSAGVSEEDIDAISDTNWDATLDLEEAMIYYLKQKYNIDYE